MKTDISRFIAKIMTLLVLFSVVGVGGCIFIVETGQGASAAAGCFGWVYLCALGYIYCVDRITVHQEGATP